MPMLVVFNCPDWSFQEKEYDVVRATENEHFLLIL